MRAAETPKGRNLLVLDVTQKTNIQVASSRPWNCCKYMAFTSVSSHILSVFSIDLKNLPTFSGIRSACRILTDCRLNHALKHEQHENHCTQAFPVHCRSVRSFRPLKMVIKVSIRSSESQTRETKALLIRRGLPNGWIQNANEIRSPLFFFNIACSLCAHLLLISKSQELG